MVFRTEEVIDGKLDLLDDKCLYSQPALTKLKILRQRLICDALYSIYMGLPNLNSTKIHIIDF